MYGSMMNALLDPETWIRKALDGTAATTGNLMIPQVIDPYIAELALKTPSLSAMVPHTPWKSGTYDKRKRTARPRARWIADAYSAPEENSTYASFSEILKVVQSKGGVTGFMQAAGQQLFDALNGEIKGATLEAIYAEEMAMLYGNTYADSYSPKGLDYWTCTGNSNIISANNATITTSYLDQALDAIRNQGIKSIGAGNAFWLMSNKMQSKISSLLQSGQRWNDLGTIEVAAGFRLRTYLDIPIMPTTFLQADQAWTGSVVTSSTASTGGALPQSSTYKYFISAVTMSGETLPCVETTQGTTASGTSTNTITLNWSAPTVSGSVWYYKIYRTAAAGGSGTEVFNTTIPGVAYSPDAVGLGFLSMADIIHWVDTDIRTSQTVTYATATVTGAAYTPGYAASTFDELAANEEDIYLVVTSANEVDGPITHAPTLLPIGYMPLAQIADKEQFLVRGYETFVTLEQYVARITRAKLT